jgi:hypothetical protein
MFARLKRSSLSFQVISHTAEKLVWLIPGDGLLPFCGEWGDGMGLGGLTPPNGFLLPGERMLDIIMAKGGAIEGGPGDRWGFRLLGEVVRSEPEPEVKSERSRGSRTEPPSDATNLHPMCC